MITRYILKGHEPIEEPDLMVWARWLEENGRIVAQTEIGQDVRVSTVFLGLDHSFGSGPPLLFETMIFGGLHDDYQERSTTWPKAETAHARAVLLAHEVDAARGKPRESA